MSRDVSEHPAQPAREVSPPSGSARINELAVVGFVCAVASFFVLPGIGAVLGIFFGKRAQREIEAAGSWQHGAALADWAVSLGYGGLLFLALTLLGLALSWILPLLGHPLH